jgi:DNA-binding NtrC family response regulator
MPTPENICVLVVGPDENLVGNLRAFLEYRGLRVVAVSGVEDDLREEQMGPVSVAVIDHPMVGEPVIEAIRRRIPRSPIVLMSAYLNPSGMDAISSEHGRIACLQKPFSGEQLLQAINDAVWPPPERRR